MVLAGSQIESLIFSRPTLAWPFGATPQTCRQWRRHAGPHCSTRWTSQSQKPVIDAVRQETPLGVIGNVSKQKIDRRSTFQQTAFLWQCTTLSSQSGCSSPTSRSCKDACAGPHRTGTRPGTACCGECALSRSLLAQKWSKSVLH